MQPKTSERLLQGITFLSTRLPQGMAQGLFAGVASVLYGLLLLTSHRRLLVNRIQHALALPSMASHRIAHRHVRMLFESLVEVARLGDDPLSLLENRVTVAGIEHLKDAQAQGRRDHPVRPLRQLGTYRTKTRAGVWHHCGDAADGQPGLRRLLPTAPD